MKILTYNEKLLFQNVLNKYMKNILFKKFNKKI